MNPIATRGGDDDRKGEEDWTGGKILN